MTEMHDVVEMLLNRMRDYPEDFVDMDYHTHVAHRANENKWTKAFGLAKAGATKEEDLALEAAYQAAKRAVYMGTALKTMLSDEEPVGDGVKLKSTSHPGFLKTSDVRQSMKLSLDQAMQDEYAKAAQRQIRDNLMNSGMFK